MVLFSTVQRPQFFFNVNPAPLPCDPGPTQLEAAATSRPGREEAWEAPTAGKRVDRAETDELLPEVDGARDAAQKKLLVRSRSPAQERNIARNGGRRRTGKQYENMRICLVPRYCCPNSANWSQKRR